MKMRALWVLGPALVLALAVFFAGYWSGRDTTGTDPGETGSASVSINCVTMAGSVFAGARIYLRVNELVTNNPVYRAEARTNDAGVARFDRLPEGEFVLFFTDEMMNPCRHRVDTTQYTGDHAGAVIGDCVF